MWARTSRPGGVWLGGMTITEHWCVQAVNWSPHGGELDQVLGEEAGEIKQPHRESLLEMSTWGPCENGFQLPHPEELQPHPGGIGEHGIWVSHGASFWYNPRTHCCTPEVKKPIKLKKETSRHGWLMRLTRQQIATSRPSNLQLRLLLRQKLGCRRSWGHGTRHSVGAQEILVDCLAAQEGKV